MSRRNPLAMAAGLAAVAAVAAAMALVIHEAQPSAPPAPPPPPRRRKPTFREAVIQGLTTTYPGLSAGDAARLAIGWPANFVDAPEGKQ